MPDEAEAAGFAERVARVLDCFAQPPHECSFMQIVRRTGLPRASAHRLIGQLVEIGFLEAGPSGRGYRLGPRLFGLLHAQLDGARLEALVRPVLSALARECGAVSFAARLVQGQVDLFATETPQDRAQSHVLPALGLRPLHACSSAKALVAFQSPPPTAADLPASRDRFTGRTLLSAADLLAEYARIRRDGYAVCDQEINEGVVSLAVPVVMPRLSPVYTLGLIALADRLGTPHRALAVLALKRAAARLAAALDPVPGAVPGLPAEPEIRHDPAS